MVLLFFLLGGNVIFVIQNAIITGAHRTFGNDGQFGRHETVVGLLLLSLLFIGGGTRHPHNSGWKFQGTLLATTTQKF